VLSPPTLQRFLAQIEHSHPCKVKCFSGKRILKGRFDLPNTKRGSNWRTPPSDFCGLPIISLPNKDLGRMNKRWNPDFEGSTFQWRVDHIEYSRPWKVLPSKSGFHLLFLLPKSSFGEHKIMQHVTYSHQTKTLGGWTKDEMQRFDALFPWFVVPIEYSRPWKVLRNAAFHLLFILPKSSFGM